MPTIQRMEASGAMLRGNVDSLMKLIAALDLAGIEIIHEGASSEAGGRGVRLKSRAEAATGEGRDRPAVHSSRAERADK